jgi:hypothetical protein
MRIIANHHRAARRLALAYLWILAVSIALHGEVLPAGPRQVMPKLTAAEQDRLAMQFAPVLVFHLMNSTFQQVRYTP